MSSDKILQKVKTGIWTEASVLPYNDGYCVVTRDNNKQVNNSGFMTADSKVFTYTAVIYDKSFNEVNRFVLNNLLMCTNGGIAISSDGKKICYINIWTMYLVDTVTGEEKVLADFSKEASQQQNFLGPDKVFFNETDDKIIFSGQSDKNGKSVESWGSINIDGSGFTNHILSKDPGAALYYNNGILAMGELSMTSTGDVALVDVTTGTENYSGKLVKGRGVDGPLFSDGGQYFAVTKLNTNSVCIEVYETATFTKLFSNTYENDNKELFYRCPKVFLSDDSRKGMLFMGGYDGIPIAMNSFSF